MNDYRPIERETGELLRKKKVRKEYMNAYMKEMKEKKEMK